MVSAIKSARIASLVQKVQNSCIPFQTRVSESAFNLMADHDVCQRCMLRMVGVRDRSVHSNIESFSSIPSKRSIDEAESPCTVCVGLLQMDYSAIASDAMKLINQYDLKDKTFSLRMQFPAQLSIRNVSIRKFLEEKIALLQEEVSGTLPDAIETREIFRYLLAESFSNASGLKFDANSPFSLVIVISHDETAEDYKFLINIPESGLKVRTVRRKGIKIVEGASGEKIARSVGKLNYQQLVEANMCPPPVIKTHSKVSNISFWHASIFLAGRYNKFQRHISNSPWFIDGRRLAEHSVEELITDCVIPLFKCDQQSYKFSSAGREDADVLMLGTGRPFYLELINPRRLDVSQEEITSIEKLISESSGGKIGVRDLQLVDRESTKVLKDSASTKSKSYVCQVQVDPPVRLDDLMELSGKTNIMLDQRTPTRVPRRSDMVRQKVIESIIIKPLPNENGDDTIEFFNIELQTSAGTYVKEFVHGDNGRTIPSIKSLLKCDSAKCLQLDVTAVHLDWPSAL